MQVNAPFPPPPGRGAEISPASTAGSEWSGMNGYQQNSGLRADGYRAPSRGDSMTPPDAFDPRPPYRAQTYAASPTEPNVPKRPSTAGSRASSRTGSIAGSRSSDGNLENPRSRSYQRMESELRQHYAILRSYLRGGSAQPPRTNKARDKLLRLSPVQFHELSTDVFDELQRRQAAAPLPNRPPRPDKVPPFLQPRPDFHEKRNQARQKLSSLPTSRFRDLSTDVFCELERRFPHFNPDIKRESTRSQSSRNGASRGPPPAGMNGYGPPPRSHTTNGSMSSNAGFPPRKGSIAQSDFPNGPNEFARPMQKQFQSNHITPNKSTMVEDDDDDDDDGGPVSRYERSSDAFGLESVLTSPRSNRDTSATSMTNGSRGIRSQPPPDELQEKISELETSIQAKTEDIAAAANHARDLEQRLEDTEKVNRDLQESLHRVQLEKSNAERDLQTQLEAAKSNDDGGRWREKHLELESAHQQLQEKYARQLQTTDEVSQQFKAHLAELREMAEATNGTMEMQHQMHTDIQKLEEEVKEWKSRYVRAKTAMRMLRASTLNPGTIRGSVGSGLANDQYHADDGLVKDVHVTKFQMAIDELLAGSRTNEPSAVLDHMKMIVTAVRGITGDVEAATGADNKTDDITKRRNKAKSKVSATANNLITATRNFAAAGGLSPVSLLDAAASHLTAAVVDLLRIVRIRPTPVGDLDDDDDPDAGLTPVNDAGYFDINVTKDLRRRSNADSIYSAISDPPEDERDPRTPVAPAHPGSGHANNANGPNGLGISTSYGPSQDETDLEDLKVYLGDQTDVLVESVQALVGSVRNEEPMPVIRNCVTDIIDVVENVIGATEGCMEAQSTFQQELISTSSNIVDSLGESKQQLENAAVTSQKHDNQPSAKEFSQTLPPLAFQVAREAKELVSTVEAIHAGKMEAEDDFS